MFWQSQKSGVTLQLYYEVSNSTLNIPLKNITWNDFMKYEVYYVTRFTKKNFVKLRKIRFTTVTVYQTSNKK